MALSPATGLANYSAGISSSVLTVDSNSDRVGIGTTNPQDTLQVGTAITMGSGAVTATQGNFQNVNVTGTLTYEDVTSVDAVGIITARSGISITGGGLNVVGDTDLVGNITGVNATGISTINNVSGTTLNITGVTTISNTVVGGATTELVVNGDARITGILTMGTSSITLDGNQNKIISGKYDFLGISTSHTDTAVDVFVYDTSKDSDGGEWRKKTSHTSWYNETLGTATRGTRKEFPAVAVIVMQEGTLTIYDGDDPDLPMWMIFTDNNDTGNFFSGAKMLSCRTATSIFMLNGIFICGGRGAWHDGVAEINFLTDSAKKYMNNGQYYSTLNISQRESTGGYSTVISGTAAIANNLINDLAMTVLPNTPIDDTTGLPVPTIVVATDGGFSIINDDETVTSGASGSNSMRTLSISDDNVVYFGNNSQGGYYPYDLKTGEYIGNARFFSAVIDGPVSVLENISNSTNKNVLFTGDDGQSLVIGMDDGLNLINGDPRNGIADNGMVAYATTSYNTGYMPGDITFATLSSTDTTNITFSNLSTNGDLADSSDLSSWTAYNATLSHQTDAMRVADNGGFSKAYQSFTTENGKTYIASVYAKTISGLNAVISVGSADPAQDAWNDGDTNAGGVAGRRYAVKFTASGPTSYIELGSEGGSFVEYQNVRIDEVKVEERSVNNNPFELYGTITKTAVATGAELVGYSGFSADNEIRSDRNAANFGSSGTVSLCIMGWFKTNTISDYQYIGSVFNQTSSNVLGIAINSSSSALPDNPHGTLYAFDNVTNQTSGTTVVNDDKWHHVVMLAEGNSRQIYLDGRLEAENSFTSFAVDITAANKVAIGHYAFNDTFPFLGSLSLVRFTESIPSPEQIKKIYDDEKYLYQDNGKATLYGSSSAVTALAYDETTDQLHVGTSSGRSDFQGLRRINNTTTAVTTAISAHDTLIIEQ